MQEDDDDDYVDDGGGTTLLHVVRVRFSCSELAKRERCASDILRFAERFADRKIRVRRNANVSLFETLMFTI